MRYGDDDELTWFDCVAKGLWWLPSSPRHVGSSASCHPIVDLVLMMMKLMLHALIVWFFFDGLMVETLFVVCICVWFVCVCVVCVCVDWIGLDWIDDGMCLCFGGSIPI